jgi:dipeptidyl-peptidase 4
VRALLEYPEFFRVGVAIAGGYDQRDSIANILEKYQGPDPATWAATDLAPLAGQLRGRLLLVWGELDDNVHPISSMRMLDAFISADRNVDVLIVPGADHFVSRHPHVHRRLAGYFIEHL